MADRCLPHDAAIIRNVADDVTRAVNALCDLRQEGKGNTPQADQLAREIREKLGHLERAVLNAVVGVEKGGHQAAHTVGSTIFHTSRSPIPILPYISNDYCFIPK